MKGLTDIPGILVGHATDLQALTGCTVVLCPGGAVAGCEIRGGASGTQEIDALSPYHVTGSVHAIVLAGGSAYGLEAAAGVRNALEKRGIGFPTSAGPVPIVPAAILYDLSIGEAKVRPTREMGGKAAAAATDGKVAEGCVGAGTGATCGKVLGMAYAMKSGIGTFTVEAAGVKVSALAAANPLGDILDPATGKILAGTRERPNARTFADSAALLRRGPVRGGFKRENTTLVVIATDARLTKVEANKVAQVAHQGLVRAVRPVHTMSDGDIVFALSLGQKSAPLDAICLAAADAAAHAIARAATEASALGGLPAARS